MNRQAKEALRAAIKAEVRRRIREGGPPDTRAVFGDIRASLNAVLQARPALDRMSKAYMGPTPLAPFIHALMDAVQGALEKTDKLYQMIQGLESVQVKAPVTEQGLGAAIRDIAKLKGHLKRAQDQVAHVEHWAMLQRGKLDQAPKIEMQASWVYDDIGRAIKVMDAIYRAA